MFMYLNMIFPMGQKKFFSMKHLLEIIKGIISRTHIYLFMANLMSCYLVQVVINSMKNRQLPRRRYYVIT